MKMILLELSAKIRNIAIFLFLISILSGCQLKLNNFNSPSDKSFLSMQYLFCLTGLDSVFCPKVPIRGVLTGKSSALPIANAKIIISDGITQNSVETSTDLNGNFSINYHSVKFNVTVKSRNDIRIGTFSASVDGNFWATISNASSEITVLPIKNLSETFFKIEVEERTFFSFLGSTLTDAIYTVLQADDGGFVLFGSAPKNLDNTGGISPIVPSTNTSDCMIAKTNSSGSLEWYTFLGGSGSDKCESAIKTKDGGYLASGTAASISTIDGKSPIKSYSGSSQFDAILYKISKDGSLEWFTFVGAGGANRVLASELLQLKNDSGYILSGYAQGAIITYSGINTIMGHTGGGYDTFLIKIKENGEGEWLTHFGGSGSDNAISISGSDDGGVVIIGNSNSSIPSYSGISVKIPYSGGGFDIFSVKYNSSGELQWFSFFGGSGADGAGQIIRTKDEGYLIAGEFTVGVSSLAGIPPIKMENGSGSCTIIKLKSSGDLSWFTFVGATGIVTSCSSAIQLADKSYMFGGLSAGNFNSLDGLTPRVFSYGGGQDSIMIKMAENGTVQWYSVIGGSGADTGNKLIQTADGGFFSVGSSNANIESIESKSPIYPFVGTGSLTDGFFYKTRADGKF